MYIFIYIPKTTYSSCMSLVCMFLGLTFHLVCSLNRCALPRGDHFFRSSLSSICVGFPCPLWMTIGTVVQLPFGHSCWMWYHLLYLNFVISVCGCVCETANLWGQRTPCRSSLSLSTTWLSGNSHTMRPGGTYLTTKSSQYLDLENENIFKDL